MSLLQPWSNLACLAMGIVLLLFAVLATDASVSVGLRFGFGLTGVVAICSAIYNFKILGRTDLSGWEKGSVAFSSLMGIVFVISLILFVWFVIELVKVGPKAIERAFGGK